MPCERGLGGAFCAGWDLPRYPLAVMSTGRPRRSVVAALTGLALAGAITSHPASADTAPAIPERLVTPDPDLPTLGEAGPIGRLAVVFGAAQAAETTSGLRSGLVGVSATTGEYRFIDLPDRAYAENGGVDFIELSPRGRRLAYRIGGPARVNGFAALDTVTGRVTTRRVPSRFGLSARVITWVSEQTLLVRYAKSQRSEEGGLEPGRARYYRWTPGGPLQMIRDVDASGHWPGRTVTRISPEGVFWESGPEHQDYLQRYPDVFRPPFPRQDDRSENLSSST